MTQELILEEIRATPYYCLIIDETTDVSNKNILSVLVRFVRDGVVIERFWGFIDVSSCGGKISQIYFPAFYIIMSLQTLNHN